MIGLRVQFKALFRYFVWAILYLYLLSCSPFRWRCGATTAEWSASVSWGLPRSTWTIWTCPTLWLDGTSCSPALLSWSSLKPAKFNCHTCPTWRSLATSDQCNPQADYLCGHKLNCNENPIKSPLQSSFIFLSCWVRPRRPPAILCFVPNLILYRQPGRSSFLFCILLLSCHSNQISSFCLDAFRSSLFVIPTQFQLAHLSRLYADISNFVHSLYGQPSAN